MSNISVFKSAGLPAVSTLAQSLRVLAADSPSATGSAILKMDRTGHWIFGADQTEVESDSKWAINPFSFVHGFIAWGTGEVLGEKLVSLESALPDMGPAPAGAAKGWESQVGMSLKCISGEDQGMEARFTSTSAGGKRAVQTLAIELSDQVTKDESKPVPVVNLDRAFYQHKQYGKIWTPVFKVVEFISMDGEAQVEEEAPKRRRTRA
jgi:hypothetical protein